MINKELRQQIEQLEKQLDTVRKENLDLINSLGKTSADLQRMVHDNRIRQTQENPTPAVAAVNQRSLKLTKERNNMMQETTILSKDEEIKALREKLEIARQEKNDIKAYLQSKLGEKDEVIEKLKGALETQKQRIIEITHHHTEELKKSKQKGNTEENIDMFKKLFKIGVSDDKSAQEIRKLKEQLQTLMGEKNKLTEELIRKNSTITYLVDDNKKLLEEHKDSTKKNEELKEQLKALKEKEEGLIIMLKENNLERSGLLAENDTLHEEIKSLTKQKDNENTVPSSLATKSSTEQFAGSAINPQ